MILEHVFSTKGQIAVLRSLFEKGGELHVSKIVEMTGLSTPATIKISVKLVRLGLARMEKKGKNLHVFLENHNPIVKSIGPLFEWEDALDKEISRQIETKVLDEFGDKAVPLAILFGSRAKKTARLDSDFDIMLVFEKRTRRQIENRLIDGFSVSIFKIFKTDFIKGFESGNPLITNVVRDAKILRGADIFDTFIRSAKNKRQA